MKALLIALSLVSVQAFGYDNTYYRANGWSGEYPNGFSVVKEGVTVPARTDMDPRISATFECGVSYKGTYHQWNQNRIAEYVTMSKIVPMTTTKVVYLEDENGKKVKVRKGRTIEYLVYGAEGYFTVRYKGKEYVAGQELLENVTYDKTLMDTPADEWIKIDCVNGANGGTGWVLMRHLIAEDQQGNTSYLDGLDTWYRGFREYGVVEDLTDEDLKKQL